jgi:hypothetical protein
MSTIDAALECLAAMRRHNVSGTGAVHDRHGGVAFGRMVCPAPPQQLPKAQRAAVVSDFTNGGLPPVD